ncbi:MAG: rRNA ((967)-C(5))-methyltransferase [Verrucomicrobiaceae bacterium]|nr:rRNA ((967)-C(5))-methyltransferase [Verrucomicrobiaceae bacterium]
MGVAIYSNRVRVSMLLDCRAAAAQVIAAVCAEGQSLERQLSRLEPSVRERDRALLRELCYGSLRWHPQLSALIKPLLQKPLKKNDGDVEQLLIVGAYQLMHTRIPAHAAINTAVEACRALNKTWAAGLINAVLRKLQREQQTLLEHLSDDARRAHPQWLWQRLRSEWPQHIETIAAANNHYPPMCLRVNKLHTARADYLTALAAADITAAACELSADGIRLHEPIDVASLPEFFEGAVSVQDEAAQLAAQLLDVQPQQRVLDACCAPGGKTCHVLELQPQLREMVALDVDAARLHRVESNLQRLNLAATVVVGDALTPSTWWDNVPFERILLDAPCSGTGVIRRHPDIKILRSESDVAQLAVLQLQLLTALWPTLAAGGILLYATCSILPDENTRVLEQFLALTSDARELPIAAEWGIAQPIGRQLLPSIDGCDGFYYARLQKI